MDGPSAPNVPPAPLPTERWETPPAPAGLQRSQSTQGLGSPLPPPCGPGDCQTPRRRSWGHTWGHLHSSGTSPPVPLTPAGTVSLHSFSTFPSANAGVCWTSTNGIFNVLQFLNPYPFPIWRVGPYRYFT